MPFSAPLDYPVFGLVPLLDSDTVLRKGVSQRCQRPSVRRSWRQLDAETSTSKRWPKG
jgi:hypothetical protein